MLSLMLTECTYTPTKEELKLGVCNYKRINTILPPSNETTISTSHISGSQKLKVGISRIYSVEFFDESKNPKNWQDVSFEWNVISDFEINQNIYDNKIELTVNDEGCIDSSFLLQVIINNNVDSEMRISVIDIV